MIRAIALLITAALAMLMLIGCGGAPTAAKPETVYVVAMECQGLCPWLSLDGPLGEAATLKSEADASAQALIYLDQAVDYELAAGGITQDEYSTWKGVVAWEAEWKGSDQDIQVYDRVKPPREFDVLMYTEELGVEN